MVDYQFWRGLFHYCNAIASQGAWWGLAAARDSGALARGPLTENITDAFLGASLYSTLRIFTGRFDSTLCTMGQTILLGAAAELGQYLNLLPPGRSGADLNDVIAYAAGAAAIHFVDHFILKSDGLEQRMV